jgi:hypothetical protein
VPQSAITQVFRNDLTSRVLPDGGIADRPGGRFRPDATAWGILAMKAWGTSPDRLEPHQARLRDEQESDGRIAISKDHHDSYWPTALAILAWHDSPSSRKSQQAAATFLLDQTGVHYKRNTDEPAGHDTQLKGWPWVSGTHSWIEPTVASVLALRISGYGEHDRVREAIKMILDRQLPHGGWNYGNSFVFERELHPMPESTGAALAALAGTADNKTVGRSLEYLEGELDRLRTPVSLGWSLLGLSAWQRSPKHAVRLVERCLANEARYGTYETSALCLLFLAVLEGERGAAVPFSLHGSTTGMTEGN